MSAARLAVYIRTTNDTNGNPRRGWMIVNPDGTTAGFVDEGYTGYPAVRERFPDAVEVSHALEVTPATYRVLERNPNGFGK